MRAITLAASTHILPCSRIDRGAVRFRDKMLGREQYIALLNLLIATCDDIRKGAVLIV